MSNSKTVLTIFALGVAMTATAGQTAAQATYGQYGQYGEYGQKGTQPGQDILIDKMVAEAGTGTGKGGESTAVYRDNLSLEDKKYNAGDQVLFRIKVKNVSNVTLKNIVVKDYVPTYLEPMVGPGSYDAKTRIITYTIKELAPDQEDIQYVKMQIYPQNKLPADQSIVKFVNKADATTDNASDVDTAQFFAEKQTIGITEVPKTGPELGLAFLALQAAGLAAGLALRKTNRS